MKKNIILILGCLGLVLFSTAAYSADGWYAGANIGLAMASDADVTEGPFSATIEYDSGFAIGAAVGYAISNFRVEGEIDWQKNDMDRVKMEGMSASLDGDTSNLAFLANGYYDFANNSAFTPFIGAGIGVAKIDVDVEGDSDDDTVFAYQLGAGVAYAINEKVSLDLKYRYLGTADPEFKFEGVTVKSEFGSHNILFGARFSF